MPPLISIYGGLFLGMLFLGEVFYVPAVYYALKGDYAFWIVFAIAIMATIISDSVWYLIGRYVSLERMRAWKWFAQRKHRLDQLQYIFSQYGLRVVFVSKFIYGTRIIAQALAGSSKIPYIRYLMVNIFGASLWFLSMHAIGWGVKGSLAQFQNTVYRDQFLFGILLIIIIVAHLWISHLVKKRWSVPSSRPLTKEKQSDESSERS